MPADVVAVIVAAGESSRLGRPKQLLPWQGTTLVGHAVAEAAAVCRRVIVVTGAERQAVENATSSGTAVCVHNPDWRGGMGTSIAAGVRHARDTGAAAVLVMTCDQPRVGRDDLAALLELWQNAPASPAAALYSGSAGVPAVFPAGWFDRLTSLSADRGARGLLRSAAESADIQTLELPAAATDIDTPEDFEILNLDTPQ